MDTIPGFFQSVRDCVFLLPSCVLFIVFSSGMVGILIFAQTTDPIFEDWDKTLGYSTPQRLLREQMKEHSGIESPMGYSGSISSRTEQYPV